MTGEFLKFLVTSGIAALVNLAARYGLNRLMPFEIAVVLAYLIGMTVAYLLARLFVFGASGRSMGSEFRRFTIVNLAGLAIVWLVSVSLARLVFPAIGFAWHPDDVAHLAGVMAPAITSYLGHRFYTFARRPT